MTIAIPGKTEAGTAGVAPNHGGAVAAVGAATPVVTTAQVGEVGLRASHIDHREVRVGPTEAIVEGPESIPVKTRRACHHTVSQHPRDGQIICPEGAATKTALTTTGVTSRSKASTSITMMSSTTKTSTKMADSMACPRTGTAGARNQWCTLQDKLEGAGDFVVGVEAAKPVRRGNQ
jgi:hypothetical protein